MGYGVDCRKMDMHGRLNKNCFNKIVFNFPHMGFEDHGASVPNDSIQEKLRLVKEGMTLEIFVDLKGQNMGLSEHQALLVEFFRSCVSCLAVSELSEIHISLKNGDPYISWKTPSLAKLVKIRVDKADRSKHQRRANLPMVVEREIPVFRTDRTINFEGPPGYEHVRTLG